jgi:transcription initiation factor TFIIIB Brf1 subunit/transcription initiation factor TFIIB
MSTLQISAPIAANSTIVNPHRPGPLLRALNAIIAAMAETNCRRAEREIARVARTYGIGIAHP